MVRERSERPEEKAPPTKEASVPAYAAPVDWWKLDAEERVETLLALKVWVPEFVRRYALKEQVVPACWYLHEALVQELLAFFQYRNQMQVLPTSPPSAMQDLHYQLSLTIARLRAWAAETGCTLKEHRPSVIPTWAQETTVQHAEWEVAVSEAVHMMSRISSRRGGNDEKDS